MTRTVVHFTDSAAFGGAEQALLHVLAGLDRRRWRPVLFHHPEPGLAPLLEEARRLDVELRAVPLMPLGSRGAARAPQFIRALQAARPAVFHAHLTWPLACKHGLTAAILARVPAIVATEQLFVEAAYSRTTRIQQRLIAKGVHCYIAVSREVARRLRQAFRMPEHKIKVVHNAIPLDSFDRPANSALRAILAGPAERPIVLTTARLDRQKGLCYLLKAAALVPEALFVLAGDGPERASLEAQAHQLGMDDRIVFLGYRQDISDLLASCDLFVLPSLFEGLPLAVLEAMAAGKPVIATAIGGTDEAVVPGETGLLVPPADPGALAEAIRALLSDPARAQRLAARGKDRAHREFSAATMVQRITHIYDEALGLREGSHGGC